MTILAPAPAPVKSADPILAVLVAAFDDLDATPAIDLGPDFDGTGYWESLSDDDLDAMAGASAWHDQYNV